MSGLHLAASTAKDAIAAAAHIGVDVTGAWAFSVVHGDIEDQADRDILDGLTALAQRTGHLLTTYGTNDTTAYVFDAAGGRLAVLAMHAEAVLTGRFWWRLHTRFGGDA